MTTAPALHASFPVGLSLQGLDCLVVGEGSAAMERVAALVACGAVVRWVGVAAVPVGLPADVAVQARPFEPGDVDDAWLVVLTDQNEDLARFVSAAARARRVFFCAVDQPAHNTFAHLALTRIGALTIAVGTGGAAPALARRLQTEFQRIFGSTGFRSYVERIVELRARLPRAERRDRLTEALSTLQLDVRF